MARNITFDFEYDQPDEYLHNTAEEGLKGTWTYNGPEKFYIFIEKATGKIDMSSGMQQYDSRDPDGSREMAQLFAGQARTAVLIEAQNEPIIATLFQQQPLASDLPQKEYRVDGDDTVYYSRPINQYMDHTYEVSEIVYDFATSSFVKPFPWKKPHVTMEQHDQARLNIIAGIDRDIDDEELNYSDEMKAKLLAFKAELQAIPTKFAGWSPWQIPFPNDPRMED